eukprot:scaffold178365_cov30-Tisochrysis_lutea.AAC.1
MAFLTHSAMREGAQSAGGGPQKGKKNFVSILAKKGSGLDEEGPRPLSIHSSLSGRRGRASRRREKHPPPTKKETERSNEVVVE